MDSSRASIFRVDSQLFTSAAVCAGAQFVSLLFARYSKFALQQALILCISSAWVVGWHLREWLHMEFRALFLEKSPRLRVATAEQVDYFAAVSQLGPEDAVLAVMQATCPSVVLAVFSLCGVVTDEFVALLKAAPSVEFVPRDLRVRSKVLTVRFYGTELALRTLDVVFHGLSRDRAWNSYSTFRDSHRTATWGAYVGMLIYRHWLATKFAHLAALVACYAAESHRPESTPLLVTSSSAALSTPSADTARRALSFSSGASSSSSSRTSSFGRMPSASQAALAVMRSGAMPMLASAAATNLKELFADTYASRNPLFGRVFSSGELTYETVKAFLDFKADSLNPMNEAKCKRLMVSFVTKTREGAEWQRPGYMVGMDASLREAVKEATEVTYAQRVGVALCYLCHAGKLKLVDNVSAEEDNLSAVMQCLVFLSTAENDTLMKTVVAHCCLDFKGQSVIIVEHNVAAISAFLSALIMVLKRTWAFKSAQLHVLDTADYKSSGQALVPIPIPHDATPEEFALYAAHNAISGGNMSVIGSMKFLFATRAMVSRFGSLTSSHIDVLPDVQRLEETGVFSAVVRGVTMTAPNIASIAYEHKRRADAKLLSVFGGVDAFEPKSQVHFAEFLKGEHYLMLDDTTSASKKMMTFSFLTASSRVVTWQDMESKIERYFESLNEGCLVEKEFAFYEALNLLQVAVGLVVVNRQTEFNTIFLRDTPGGMFRTFRGFDIIRCPLTGEPLILLYRLSDKWRGNKAPEACASLVHPLFNRPLLVAACFRRAIAKLVQRRSKEDKIREYILDNFFLDNKGQIIEPGSSFSSTSFNDHVRSAIETMNMDTANAIPLPATLAVDEDDVDVEADDLPPLAVLPVVTPIAFFVQSLLRALFREWRILAIPVARIGHSPFSSVARVAEC